MPKPPRPLPPPAPEQPGACTFSPYDSATGWRWFPGLGTWERVCSRHYTATTLRLGDYVPDTAIVERQAP